MTEFRLKRRPLVDAHNLPSELHPRLRQIYASRGVTHAEQLNRSAAGLLSPQGLKGLPEAMVLLTNALEAQQKIIIVGDFDCDGATSTTLMVLALRALGAGEVDHLVPNRFEYGYGLSPEIAAIAAQQGAQLLITVDNGISSFAGVETARAAGMKVLVTDHHLPGDAVPDADAIVNPNQQGCQFGSGNLAGVGVAFYLMAAFKTHLQNIGWFEKKQITPPNIADFLDLVALGTVADVVSLDGNNRILVHQGLQRIRAGRCRPGIRALCEVAGRDLAKLTANDLGYFLGPRLNAVGRLDDMTMGIACLLSNNEQTARHLASQMDALNQERKSIESSMQDEAFAALSRMKSLEGEIPAALVLHQDDWHQGVVGLVASRIKEKYHRPVFAFAESSDTELKGSGRSIAGLHMRDALERLDQQHPDLILKYGGHAMAAGLSIEKTKLNAFRKHFETLVSEWLTPEQLMGVVLTDGELKPDELSMSFAEVLREAGPWGQAFPEPTFDGVFRLKHQRLVGAKHLKMEVEMPSGPVVDAIAFNVDLASWPNPNCKEVQLVYRLDINEWRGQQSVQLLVEHVIPLR